jgi:hypothetical protein
MFFSFVALCCFVGYACENCSAIVDADTPEDGNIKPKRVVWKCQNKGREIVAFKDCKNIYCMFLIIVYNCYIAIIRS